MTIETANRLFQLRKQQGLSQEELAEKLGVSRQAVSKWERSEASPDTDNLIALAKIYGLTLDELIYGIEEKPEETPSEGTKASDETSASADGEDADDASGEKIGVITVRSKDGEMVTINADESGVNIKHETVEAPEDGADEIHINGISSLDEEAIDDAVGKVIKSAIKHGLKVESKHGKGVDIDFRNGISIKERGDADLDDDDDDDDSSFLSNLEAPYTILCVAVYLIFGCYNIWGGWGRAWIILLTIPLWISLVEAIRYKRTACFCYPVFTAFVYLYIGLYHGIWHPSWIVFITIAIYYPVAEAIDKVIIKHRKKEHK